MRSLYLSEEAIHNFISSALAEDIGEGDHSTLGAVSPTKKSKARLLIKDDGIIAGLEIAERIFRQVNPLLQITFLKEEG
jgi:nicotinate-nucleotide pyrophosphorylase (carboxylating)